MQLLLLLLSFLIGAQQQPFDHPGYFQFSIALSRQAQQQGVHKP